MELSDSVVEAGGLEAGCDLEQTISHKNVQPNEQMITAGEKNVKATAASCPTEPAVQHVNTQHDKSSSPKASDQIIAGAKEKSKEQQLSGFYQGKETRKKEKVFLSKEEEKASY